MSVISSANSGLDRVGMPLQHAQENELLACLPLAVKALWFPHLELVDLDQGEVLHEPDGRMPYVYFPLTAIAAQLYALENGESAESALIGYKGMVGFPVILGGDSTSSRAVVLIAGEAWRVRAAFVQHQVRSVPAVLHLMLRFVQAMMTQMNQTAVCNRHHSIDQQLCRLFLLITERLPVSDFPMTQGLLAATLGVRRESVTEAAGLLQRAGLVRYKRGHITVLDRTGLQRRACECYQVVRQEYARLLPYRLAT